MLMFDGDLNQIKDLNYQDLEKSVVSATCLHSGSKRKSSRFIVSFNINESGQSLSQNYFEGKNRPGFNCLLAAGILDENKH